MRKQFFYSGLFLFAAISAMGQQPGNSRQLVKADLSVRPNPVAVNANPLQKTANSGTAVTATAGVPKPANKPSGEKMAEREQKMAEEMARNYAVHLQLSDAQKPAVYAACLTYLQRLDATNGKPVTREANQQLMAETDRTMKEVLTAGQVERLQKMRSAKGSFHSKNSN